MLLKTTFATLVLAATILAEGNDSAAIDDVPRFTFYEPPGEREKIGASACDWLLERECPKWKLNYDKWVQVDMQQYKGDDEDVNYGTYFAPPSTCQTFLERGEISATQFIRHCSSLAYDGLWSWTDPDIDKPLQTVVGRKLFDLIGDLNTANLNKLVALDLKKKVQYLDYPTECKLRNLLRREQEESAYGRDARESLRYYRGFYGGWGQLLFKDQPVQEDEIATVTAAVLSVSNATQTANLTSGAESLKHGSFWLSLGGVLLVML